MDAVTDRGRERRGLSRRGKAMGSCAGLGCVARAPHRRRVATIKCGRGKRKTTATTATWATGANKSGNSSGMWRSNAGATVGGDQLPTGKKFIAYKW
ncbi:hypothetical protein B296_00026206 [Ensete ventricosum]|uniref:Uncharacterized protein n=1 Tax=Ensete ventricosum TaxID=4639 RepID=A0A426XZ43_ENSVE|nr:hypothetical protein B296_00026206 [Ensete ventricosum]